MKSGFDQFAWGEAGGKRKRERKKAPLWLSFRGAKRHFRESLRTCAPIYKKENWFCLPGDGDAHYPNDVSTRAKKKRGRQSVMTSLVQSTIPTKA